MKGERKNGEERYAIKNLVSFCPLILISYKLEANVDGENHVISKRGDK